MCTSANTIVFCISSFKTSGIYYIKRFTVFCIARMTPYNSICIVDPLRIPIVVPTCVVCVYGNIIASTESIVTHTCYRCGDADLFETATSIERIQADRCNCIGNNNICKRGTVIECIRTYRSDLCSLFKNNRFQASISCKRIRNRSYVIGNNNLGNKFSANHKTCIVEKRVSRLVTKSNLYPILNSTQINNCCIFCEAKCVIANVGYILGNYNLSQFAATRKCTASYAGNSGGKLYAFQIGTTVERIRTNQCVLIGMCQLNNLKSFATCKYICKCSDCFRNRNGGQNFSVNIEICSAIERVSCIIGKGNSHPAIYTTKIFNRCYRRARTERAACNCFDALRQCNICEIDTIPECPLPYCDKFAICTKGYRFEITVVVKCIICNTGYIIGNNQIFDKTTANVKFGSCAGDHSALEYIITPGCDIAKIGNAFKICTIAKYFTTNARTRSRQHYARKHFIIVKCVRVNVCKLTILGKLNTLVCLATIES